MKVFFKANLTLLVLTIALLSLAATAFAVCGAETRTTIDSLKCDDLAASTWYQVDVNQMCGTLSGENQSVVELVEKRPGTENVRKSIFKSQVKQILFEAKDAAEIELFKQRAGEKGSIEGYAIPSEDKQSIQSVKIRIVPNGGDECTKTVDVSGAWEKSWS